MISVACAVRRPPVRGERGGRPRLPQRRSRTPTPWPSPRGSPGSRRALPQTVSLPASRPARAAGAGRGTPAGRGRGPYPRRRRRSRPRARARGRTEVRTASRRPRTRGPTAAGTPERGGRTPVSTTHLAALHAPLRPRPVACARDMPHPLRISGRSRPEWATVPPVGRHARNCGTARESEVRSLAAFSSTRSDGHGTAARHTGVPARARKERPVSPCDTRSRRERRSIRAPTAHAPGGGSHPGDAERRARPDADRRTRSAGAAGEQDEAVLLGDGAVALLPGLLQ